MWDLAAAAVTVSDDGAVVIDAPRAPWLIHARITDDARPTLAELSVIARDHQTVTITNARLGRLPVRQILHLAITHLTATTDPAEVYWRLLATPKPPGARQWPDDHWGRVLHVYGWGRRCGRPGGGTGAVSDLWQVSRRTAARWIATARRRRPAGGETVLPPAPDPAEPAPSRPRGVG